MEDVSVRELLFHYERLLGLYEKLESVSCDVFNGLESGKRAGEIAARLKESAEVAERIGAESRIIVSLKETLADRNVLDESDRSRVRESEKRLSETVNRLVEQENRNRDLISSRGVKISRR